MDSRTMIEAGDSSTDVPKQVSKILIDRIENQKENEKLDLSLCNIKTVPLEHIHKYYGEPTDLDLSYNSIRYLSPQFTMNMLKLTRLDLSRNDLRRLPDNFGDIADLMYLDLHGNRLETLPLSMGKMERLQYLNVSDNAFRAPLSNFLGKKSNGHDIPGVIVADYVTAFLREISVKMEEETELNESNNERNRLIRQRSSKVHYRTRSANLTMNDISSEELDLDTNNSIIDKARERRMKNIWITIPILAFVLLLPIIVAYGIETTFLDQFADENPWFKSFWSYYKMIHEYSSKWSSSFPKNPLQIKGRKPPHVEVYNYFTNIPNSIMGCFSYAWEVLSSPFK